MNIGIKEFEIFVKIGCEDIEKQKLQKLLIDIEIEIDDVDDDDIKNTVDFRDVILEIKNFTKIKNFELLESFAKFLKIHLEEKLIIKKVKFLKIKKFFFKNCKYTYVTI
jgi:dihydroneopterin aldolase